MAKTSTFIERFNMLLSRSGKSDSALAEELGVSKQAVSAWKTGARSPKRPNVIDITNYFNVDTYWLMGYDEGEYTYSDAFRRNAQELLDNADPADLEAISAHSDIGLVSRVIKGAGPLTLDAACNVADILGESVSCILNPETGETIKSVLQEEDGPIKEAFELMLNLSKDKQRQAVEILRVLAAPVRPE